MENLTSITLDDNKIDIETFIKENMEQGIFKGSGLYIELHGNNKLCLVMNGDCSCNIIMGLGNSTEINLNDLLITLSMLKDDRDVVLGDISIPTIYSNCGVEKICMEFNIKEIENV